MLEEQSKTPIVFVVFFVLSATPQNWGKRPRYIYLVRDGVNSTFHFFLWMIILSSETCLIMRRKYESLCKKPEKFPVGAGSSMAVTGQTENIWRTASPTSW